MYGGIADDAAWQHRWCRLAAQSASWYATPSGAVGRHFTAILAVGWRGVLSWSWNSERPLVFAHVVLTKTMGVRQAREIRARITRRMDHWERGQHDGLVGGGRGVRGCLRGQGRLQRSGGGRRRGPEFPRDSALAKDPPGRPWATDREGGRCLLPEDLCTKTGRPVAEVLREKYPDMRVPPRGKPHVKSSSVKLRGIISVTSSYY